MREATAPHAEPSFEAGIYTNLEAFTERIAELVAEKLEQRLAPLLMAAQAPAATISRLVDAATIARELNVDRSWVYMHADELGAHRLGDGPKARLRFDLEKAREATARCVSSRSQAEKPSAGAKSRDRRPQQRRRLPNGAPIPGSILAVRPRGAA